MKQIPIAKAKATFSELVERASLGEAVTITVRGKAAAVLGPLPQANGNHAELPSQQAPQASPIMSMSLAALLRSVR